MDPNQSHPPLPPPAVSCATRWIGAILINLCWFLIFVALSFHSILYESEYHKTKSVISDIFTTGCCCGILAFMTPCCDNYQNIQSSDRYGRTVLRPQMAEITVRRRISPPPPNFFGNMCIARLASASLLVLPPVGSFQSEGGSCGGGDETEGSVSTQCAVCLEEFKNGELIQPFP